MWSNEKWAAYPPDPRYEVSDLGSVRRADSKKLLKPGLASHGYYTVALGRGNTKSVHRMVAETFLECLGSCVNHKDGNKHNNSVDNLEWVSRARNNKHARETDLNIGFLLESERELIADLRAVMRPIDIARLFGITYKTVWKICRSRAS
jgi:hypothetical protein